jgi:signal peptidase II
MGSGPADLVTGTTGARAAAPPAVNTNGVVFWPVAVVVLVADLLTKALAEAALGPAGFPHRLFGDAVRLNLVYNPGAAFGLTLGPYSRAIFLALTAVILRVLWSLYKTTPDRHDRRVFALALLVGGAGGERGRPGALSDGRGRLPRHRVRAAPVADVQHRGRGGHHGRGAAVRRVLARGAAGMSGAVSGREDDGRSLLPIAAAIVAGVVILDQYTKHLAVDHLVRHVPRPVMGEAVRFTLTYNPGAAFGMHLGEASRVVFTLLTFVILGFLGRLYRSLPPAERALRLAIAAVMGGAIGNLIDRFRSPLGVVDFIDVGVGDVRFWTFNVADAAVSVGAVLLVLLLWRYEGRVHAAAEAAGGAAGESA